MRKGFTLIELLIVVAIIAILAAIAVPNFLEAQTRAKISRVQSDMRTLATAFQCYMVDNNKTPYLYEDYNPNNLWMYNAHIYKHFDAGRWYCAIRLTTPVAYLDTIVWQDPFNVFAETNLNQLTKCGYVALSLQGALADGKYVQASLPQTSTHYSWLAPRTFVVDGSTRTVSFLFSSPGPDKLWGIGGPAGGAPRPAAIMSDTTGETARSFVQGEVPLYDPTNGTTSAGDIMRFE
ncbi:prepilin-type N-terminal cleavage/methylation domain-containing protein [bacterium]|nr:prepilin-type N-terminal cleavage/methylation domain-containing protein [bacterium]